MQAPGNIGQREEKHDADIDGAQQHHLRPAGQQLQCEKHAAVGAETPLPLADPALHAVKQRRYPDGGVEQANRLDVQHQESAEAERHRAQPRRFLVIGEQPQVRVGEAQQQQDVQNLGQVEGDGRGEQHVQQNVDGIERRGLHHGQVRHAAENVRVPQWQRSGAKHFRGEGAAGHVVDLAVAPLLGQQRIGGGAPDADGEEQRGAKPVTARDAARPIV